jgi:hypothetical protein
MFLAGLIISAFAGAMQYKAAQDQAKAQTRIAEENKKQQEIQRRMADVKAARDRARTVRESRIKRATMVSQAEATGGAGGSALAGATGSLQTRAAGEIGFNLMGQAAGQKIFASNQAISGYNVDIAKAGANSALWGAVGGVGKGMFSAGGGWNQVGKMMGN